jgi:hypothetical protein
MNVEYRAFAACAVVLSLSGCGGAPNDQDIQQAMRETMRKLAGDAGVNAQKKNIDSIKLIECKKAESNGYRCDWNGDMGAGSGRFVKSDAGWVLVP